MIGRPGGILGYWWSRCERALVNRFSQALYPGCIKLSRTKLRRLCPELFPSVARPSSIVRWLVWDSMSSVYVIGDILVHGGSGPALVMSTDPLLVASYSQNLDCVAMLRFPSEFVDEYGLRRGSRLLTVLNCFPGSELAPDLEDGPDSWEDCTNFIPFIADFLTEDVRQLETRKAGIAEHWWDWTHFLGEKYLKNLGPVARDGRPTRCWIPAMPDRL